MKRRASFDFPEVTQSLKEEKVIGVFEQAVQSIFQDIDCLRLLYNTSDFQFSPKLEIDDPLIANCIINADYPSQMELTVYDACKTVLRHYIVEGNNIKLIYQMDSFNTRLLLMINNQLRKRGIDESYQLTEISDELIGDINQLITDNLVHM